MSLYCHADSSLSNQSLDSEIHSPNDMLVDPDEYIVEAPESERGDVAIIGPEQLNGQNVEQLPELPTADDCASPYQFCLRMPGWLTGVIDEAMKELVLPTLPEEPKILADAVHTWNIEGWRSMSKKEHGPVFQTGGYPW
jgi:ubiquitin carboxyl-terminal hydrolase 7